MRAPNRPVLFHPDCNRRLRNRTESADPADCSAGARGLWRSLAITAGGDFHPAPRTRSERTPTNAIKAPLANPCNPFSPGPAHADRELLPRSKDRFEARRSCPCSPTAAFDLRCGRSNEPRWVHQRAGPLAARVTARRNPDLRTAPKPLKSLGIPPEFGCEMVRPSLPAIRRRRESRRAQAK